MSRKLYEDHCHLLQGEGDGDVGDADVLQVKERLVVYVLRVGELAVSI